MKAPLHDSHYVIEKVEQYLQNKLDENRGFNDEVNSSALVEIAKEGPKVKVTSLTDPETHFSYDVSDILFWIERETYFDEFSKWNGAKLTDKHESTIDYLRKTNQLPLFQDLIAAIQRQRIAPFIGAGASYPAGYPIWRDALESLAKQLGDNVFAEIKDALDEYRYLYVAEHLYKKNEPFFNNYIQTDFRLKPRYEEDDPIFPPVIEVLPMLAKGCIVTTNFDRLIEKKFEQVNSRPLAGYMYGKQAENGFVSQLLKGENCLMKLHGDLEQSQSYVFTESQYNEAYGTEEIDFSKQLPRSLRQIYISYSLLFIGCSLEQDRTLDLFQSVKAQGHFEIPSHFALLPESEGEDKATKMGRLLDMNIRPIWYESKDKDHSMLEKLLLLAIDVAEKKFSLGG